MGVKRQGRHLTVLFIMVIDELTQSCWAMEYANRDLQ